MAPVPTLTFQQLYEIRNTATKTLAGDKTHMPLINKDIMQYWTSPQALAFFQQGGLSFPASYSPSDGALPPNYESAATSTPAAPPAAAPVTAPAPVAQPMQFTKGKQPTKASKWMRCVAPKPGAPLRVVFFPWTGNRGGQGSVFSTTPWPKVLQTMEVYEVMLPGRGMRMGEKLRTETPGLVSELAKEIGGALKGGAPYVFVGFAFGAILAHETADAIRRTMSSAAVPEGPCALAAVSCEGPSWTERRGTEHTKSAAAFEGMLRAKGGTEPILEDPDIAEMFVPIIKADLQLEETYTPAARGGQMPVLAVRGGQPGKDKEHTLVDEAAAKLWVDVGSVASRVHTLPQHDWYLFEDARGTEATLREVEKFVREHVKL